MKKLFWLFTILLLSSFAFSQLSTQSPPQTYSLSVQTPYILPVIGSGTQYYQISWNVIGSLSACTVEVDSSTTGTGGWGSADIIAAQTCTGSGNFTSTAHTVNYVRINTNASITGTGSLVVTLTGYLNNPAGGGGGTVSANNGSVGALTNYAAAGGSTTVGPDSTATDNGTTFTYTGSTLVLPLGSLTTPSIQATGSASNTGLFWSSTPVFCEDSAGTAFACLNGSGLETNATGIVGWPSAGGATGARDTGLSRKAPSVVTIGNGSAGDGSGLLMQGGAIRTTAAFTTAGNTNLQTITGLSWSLPATALNYTFHCAGYYSQATGVAAVSFGIQAVTNAPTNINATGTMYTGPTAVIDGVLTGLNTTTATTIVTSTPAATGVNTTFYLDGVIENPALANSISILVSTGNSADLVTVGRGTTCQLWITGS